MTTTKRLHKCSNHITHPDQIRFIPGRYFLLTGWSANHCTMCCPAAKQNKPKKKVNLTNFSELQLSETLRVILCLLLFFLREMSLAWEISLTIADRCSFLLLLWRGGEALESLVSVLPLLLTTDLLCRKQKTPSVDNKKRWSKNTAEQHILGLLSLFILFYYLLSQFNSQH